MNQTKNTVISIIKDEKFPEFMFARLNLPLTPIQNVMENQKVKI